jgi:hypothetical protein
MSFEISELMVQVTEMICQPGSNTKSIPQEKPECRSNTKAAPEKPECKNSTKSPIEPDIICTTSNTKALYEEPAYGGTDLDAVRAQLRERLATV